MRSLVALSVLLLSSASASALTFFIDDVAGFNAATSGLIFAGIEDFESSTLGPNLATSFLDPLAPGVANGPFPTGTNPATGLTVKSNTLGGMPSITSPGANLATASAGFFGTPTDQVSTSNPDASFDMIFGLPNTFAVSFTPLVFDFDASGNDGIAQLRVFDSSNNLIGSLDNIAIAGFTNPTTFIGIVAMPGEDIGRINLFATSDNDIYTGADNISVYLTPIPAALPLLASGLGLFGALGWRRKRNTAVA